eukprot:9667376-Lingulodinium_polyedra.AAC.1
MLARGTYMALANARLANATAPPSHAHACTRGARNALMLALALAGGSERRRGLRAAGPERNWAMAPTPLRH